MSEELNFDEFSTALDVPRHVIHLWTKKFPVLSPQRNTSGKIGFKNRDLLLAKGLKYLLIQQQKPIKDVQTLLNKNGVAHIIDLGKQHGDDDDEKAKPFLSLKPSPKKFGLANKEIAKQAFNNLNSIFSKEKTKKIDPTISQEEPLEKKLNQEVEKDSVSTPEATPALQADIVNFEENWRHHMEKAGRATPIEEAREKSHTVDSALLSDIWEIDDEIELFNEEPEAFTPNIDLKNNMSRKNNMVAPQSVHKTHMPSHTSHNDIHASSSLSIENSEKIRHLIAKLDIMRNEMQMASTVINNTLKAFGYSGFESTYEKFDQKSAY